MPATRAQLVTRAKERGDFENDSNIGTTVWNGWADQEVKTLWRLLAKHHPDHFTAGPTEFTLSGTTDTKALTGLTPGFWKLRALDYSNGGTWEKVPRFSFEQRNRVRRAYRLMGNSLRITPPGAAEGTYRYWYVPAPTAFSGDSSEIDLALDMYDELIVLGMAIRGRKRQQKEHAELSLELADLLRDVMAHADDRDTGEPDAAIDIDGGFWEDELPGAL